MQSILSIIDTKNAKYRLRSGAMTYLKRIFMMIGISAILYQVIGNTLKTNQAMLLVGLACGIVYAVFAEVE